MIGPAFIMACDAIDCATIHSWLACVHGRRSVAPVPSLSVPQLAECEGNVVLSEVARKVDL